MAREDRRPVPPAVILAVALGLNVVGCAPGGQDGGAAGGEMDGRVGAGAAGGAVVAGRMDEGHGRLLEGLALDRLGGRRRRAGGGRGRDRQGRESGARV